MARSSTPSEPRGVRRVSAASRTETTANWSGARSFETGGSGSLSRADQRSGITTASSDNRFDQPTRSSPGSGGRSSGHPRHNQPSGTTSAGRSSRDARSSGGNSVTQPTPSPSARAASHKFSMAQMQDHRSASGNVRRPRTPAAGARRSQQTTMPMGASRMPSSCRSRRCLPAAGVRSPAWASRS